MSRKGTRKAPTKKGQGKPKDTNAPKRPQSSYFLFMNERRPILKKQHADKSMTEISKLISKEWKELQLDDKQKYQDKASELKAAHKIELDEYKQTDAYNEYQSKLAAWKDAQNEAGGDSDDEDSHQPTSGRGASGKRQTRASAAAAKKKANGAATAAKKKGKARDEDESEEESSSENKGESEESSSSDEEEESEEEDVSSRRKKVGHSKKGKGK